MQVGPRLRVYWDPDRTGETRLIPNPTGVLVPTRRFHVVVKNEGETTAIECRGFIDGVEPLDGGVSGPAPDFPGRLPLEWSCTGGRIRTDIEPTRGGPKHRLCICKVPMDSFFFHLVSPVGDAALPRQYSMGAYRMTITVGCKNAQSASCRLEIEFSGRADSMMIREVDAE